MKYVCIFVAKKDSEIPVLNLDFTFWQCLVVIRSLLFLTYVNKNLILFVTNAITLKAFKKLYST